jgi:hypothetical protein
MGTKFWLQFAIMEALDVLTAYGAAVDPDPTLQQKVMAANVALKDLISYLTGPAALVTNTPPKA